MESPYEKHNILNLLMSNDGRDTVKSAFERAGMHFHKKDTIPDLKTDITYVLLQTSELNKDMFVVKGKHIETSAKLDAQDTNIQQIKNNVTQFIQDMQQTLNQYMTDTNEKIKLLQASVDERILQDTLFENTINTLKNQITKMDSDILNVRIDADALK